MSEKESMIRDIHVFLFGSMGWEDAIQLIRAVAKSEEWIDYLLDEMEKLKYAYSQGDSDGNPVKVL